MGQNKRAVDGWQQKYIELKKQMTEIQLKEAKRLLDCIIGKDFSEQGPEERAKEKLRKMKFIQPHGRIPCTEEQMRIMDYIHKHEPESIYELAKGIKRNFKNVYQDVQELARSGFIKIKENNINGRRRAKPIPVIDVLSIEIRFYTDKHWKKLLKQEWGKESLASG